MAQWVNVPHKNTRRSGWVQTSRPHIKPGTVDVSLSSELCWWGGRQKGAEAHRPARNDKQREPVSNKVEDKGQHLRFSDLCTCYGTCPHMFSHKHTCAFTHPHSHIHTHTLSHTHIRSHTLIHSHSPPIHSHTHTHIHSHTNTLSYTLTHTHSHPLTHSHTVTLTH